MHANRNRFASLIWIVAVLALSGPANESRAGLAAFWQQKVEADLLTSSPQEPTEFLVILAEQADLSGAGQIRSKQEKGRYVFDRLTEVAQRSQVELIELLRKDGAEHREFWITNAIWVRGRAATIERLARHRAVARITANPRIRMDLPAPEEPGPANEKSTTATEWNLLMVRGPEAWAEGNEGQAAVIGGIDTGYNWNHAALINQYRGWNGASADHNYNWHDAIHVEGSDCGADSPEPCDDGYHGTHTMGIMVGDDGGDNRIGLAPSARWIGCRCMDEGFGTPASYIECLQWMIAPTDLSGLNPDPDLAPDVINNSWVCPASEGCVDPNALLAAVESVRAAGIVVVASAGNGGPNCNSVQHPPAIYDASFSVGATNDSDVISNFSSRGPVLVDGSWRLKPDVSAPGQSVRSSVPGDEYLSASGTSMAGPHVAALVALVITANEDYRGAVDRIEMIIRDTAVPKTAPSEDCGGFSGLQIPNAVYGYGRIDAYEAHYLALTHVVGVPDARRLPAVITLLRNVPNPFNPQTEIFFELATRADVSLKVFDVTGRQLRTLLENVDREAGRHSVLWDGRDDRGRSVASGAYICRIEAGGESVLRRMTLLR